MKFKKEILTEGVYLVSTENGRQKKKITKEDLQQLGVETSGAGTGSLEEAAKKKGGSLTMEDLMKLSGV